MPDSESNREAAAGGNGPGTRTESPAGPSHSVVGPTEVPAQAPRGPGSPGSFRVGLCLSVLSVAVAAFWLLAWSLSRPDPRNNPESLLTPNGRTAPVNLPAVSELKTNLSAEDLAFGELQVERMVQDRPEMTRYVGTNEPVWQFCARAFAGEAIGQHVYWEDSLPVRDEYLADHQDPYKGEQGWIRIRKVYASGYLQGSPLPCEELWSCAVFEIENLRNHEAFMALFELGLQGRLSREEWIREHTKLEYAALRRTADRYRTLWRPRAQAHGVWTSGEYWGAGAPTNYESWILLYRDPNSYPWNVYGRWYDLEILPYVRRSKH